MNTGIENKIHDAAQAMLAKAESTMDYRLATLAFAHLASFIAIRNDFGKTVSAEEIETRMNEIIEQFK